MPLLLRLLLLALVAQLKLVRLQLVRPMPPALLAPWLVAVLAACASCSAVPSHEQFPPNDHEPLDGLDAHLQQDDFAIQ